MTRPRVTAKWFVLILLIGVLVVLLVVLSNERSSDVSLTIDPTMIAEKICPALDAGTAYLKAQYNPEVGLIREAPMTASNIYWLTNDNALAAYALSLLGEVELSQKLLVSIRGYGDDTNGMIEVIWGRTILFPPNTANPALIQQVGLAEIWQETHTNTMRFNDWKEYANLGFIAALNNENKDKHKDALKHYAEALQSFDQIGFKDKAYEDLYETYKLALALYAGNKINAPDPYAARILEVLLSLQNKNGGFFSHYSGENSPAGDTNTETTALTLLALRTFGCGE